MTLPGTVPNLGDDLRALRKTRGLTLTDVATRLDCSIGWLSQVERGQSNAGIDTLKDLAALYEVPVSLFFGPAPARAGETGYVVRAADRRVLGSETAGLTEALLSPDLTDDFAVLHCSFAPRARLRATVQRDTQEVAVLTSGALDLEIGPHRFSLATGDSFRIRGEPYRWANPHAIAATAIWVIAPPVY